MVDDRHTNSKVKNEMNFLEKLGMCMLMFTNGTWPV